MKYESLYYYYQPIVDIHSGWTFGVEALLRGWQGREAWSDIAGLFNFAYRNQLLKPLNQHLIEKATQDLISHHINPETRLFYNLDNRLFELFEQHPSLDLSTFLAIPPLLSERLVLEVSEQQAFNCYHNINHWLENLQQGQIQMAIDDFGSGFANLQLLYFTDAKYLKLDRFLINEINKDSRKRILTEHIVNLAHQLGTKVIAECVETEAEYFTCREIGCDLIQGYLIAPPTAINDIHKSYPIIQQLRQRHKRIKTNHEFINRELDKSTPLKLDNTTDEMLQHLSQNRSKRLIPVVNQHHEPLGILEEAQIKAYLYNPYGISLMKNQSFRKTLPNFITSVPTINIHSSINTMLRIYNEQPHKRPLIITQNSQYCGILDEVALLNLIHEEQIAIARDQNPLTGLKGNHLIQDFLSAIIDDPSQPTAITYVDLNDFKPFNDFFGFRLGDRLLIRFAEILRDECPETSDSGYFIGHIGGDDFFIGYRPTKEPLSEAAFLKKISQIQTRFCFEAESFYTPEQREHQFLETTDRHGQTRKFPLLSFSAAILFINANETGLSPDLISHQVSALKKEAKAADDHIAFALFQNAPQPDTLTNTALTSTSTKDPKTPTPPLGQ